MKSVELTTAARVALELGIECSSDVEKYLLPVIRSVSSAAERYCGRKFAYDAAAVQTVAGMDGPRVRLNRTPIRSLTSLDLVDTDGSLTSMPLTGIQIEDLDEDGNGASGLLYSASGFSSMSLCRPAIAGGLVIGTERQAFRFVFAGGWVTPYQEANDETVDLERDLPYDLEDAIVLDVASRYHRRGRDSSIREESILSASVGYNTESITSGISNATKHALLRYRRVSDGVMS